MMKVFATEIPCICCNYDLRGNDHGSICPECGLSAARSRQLWSKFGSLSRRWLRDVRIAVLLLIIAMFLLPTMILQDPLRELYRSLGLELSRAYFLNALICDFIALLVILSIWLLTRVRQTGSRRWLRWVILPLLIARCVGHLTLQERFLGIDLVFLRSVEEVTGFFVFNLCSICLVFKVKQVAADADIASPTLPWRRIARCWIAAPITLISIFVVYAGMEELNFGGEQFEEIFMGIWIGWFGGLIVLGAGTWATLIGMQLQLKRMRIRSLYPA